jgi:hypothetical protein
VEARVAAAVTRQLGRDAERVTVPVIPQHPRLTPDPVDVHVRAPLLAGPVGAHLAVFDYSVDLDGLLPAATPGSDGSFPAYDLDDPRFHQLNAYAIASRAIELVDRELGRGLGWGFDGNRLIVLPHAGSMANAFYSEDTQSLQLFSFLDEEGRVYHTSLVHDIVAHETGHAVLDAIRDHYTEGNHPDTAAIHEAIGDLTAVLAALSHQVVRGRVLAESPLDLHRANVVADIAEEFEPGVARGKLAPLRTLTTPEGGPDPNPRSEEPHDRSLQLSRAVWDGLARVHARNLERGVAPAASLELARQAVQRMVLRALDYLPPADATFADVARAVIAADRVSNETDQFGFRPAVAQAFADWGLGPSASELLGLGAPEAPWPGMPATWPRLSATEAYLFLDANRDRLAIAPNPEYRDFVLRSFHVTSRPPEHVDVEEVVFVYEYPIDVQLPDSMFAAPLAGRWLTIWGGGTLVFDPDGHLRHHAEKPVTRDRVAGALRFLSSQHSAGRALLVEPTPDDEARSAIATTPFLLEVDRTGVRLRSNPSARCGGRSTAEATA